MATASTVKDFESLPDAAFLDVRAVARLYSTCPSTIWRWCKSGRFPQPVKLTAQTTRWRVGDVRAALASPERG